MTDDERAIPTELRNSARAIVGRIQSDHNQGKPVAEGRLWAAADALREMVDALEPKPAA